MKALITLCCLLVCLPVLPVGRQASLWAQSSDVEMEAITVQGDTRPVSTIEKAGTGSVVTSAEIEEKSSKLLRDTLTQIPGIKVTTDRAGRRSLNLRGYGQDKVAITVDGVPVIDTFAGSMDIDNIGLLDVSEVVIHRGTTSALYGTKGSAGAINIYKAPPSAPYVKLNVQADHLGSHFMSAAHGARFGGFYYMLSGSYDKSYGYEISKRLTRNRRISWLEKLGNLKLYDNKTMDYIMNKFYRDVQNNQAGAVVPYYLDDTGKWDYTNHTKYKTNAKIGYFITDNLEVGLTGFYNHSRMKSSRYYSDNNSKWSYDMAGHFFWSRLDESLMDVLQNQSNRWPKYDDRSIAPFLNYNGERLSIKSTFYYYDREDKYFRYIDPKEKYGNMNDDPTTDRWSIWTNRTYGFTVMPSYRFVDFYTLSFALTWYRNQHTENQEAYSSAAIALPTLGKYKTMDISADYLTIAVENEIKLNSWTNLSAGISYDAQNLTTYKTRNTYARNPKLEDMYKVEKKAMLYGTRDSFNPVIGVISEPLKDFLKLRGSLSYKTAFPSLQAYSRVKRFGDGRTTDTKLNPEKSLNGNVGGGLSFFNKSLVLGCDFFFSLYKDKIVSYYDVDSRVRDYVYGNADGAYLTGTESSITYSRPDIFNIVDMSVGFTYTFTHLRNTSKVENSNINRGKYFELQPAHKLTIDYKAVFPKFGTSLFIFGYAELDQRWYTMRDRPERYTNFTAPFSGSRQNTIWSTKWFNPTKLNNPVMMDVKLSQKFRFFEDYELELYILCKNIFDDYLADPFNPGPGRTWLFGVNASWN